MRESFFQDPNLIKRIAFRIMLAITSIFCVYTPSFADTKVSPEEAFAQGQKYLEQANTPLAEVSLTRISPSSPYAKLLAGNIAAKNGDIDRTFLLLLPLQSNTSLIKPAAASLHASLSNAYEKQGDSLNALDQLIRRETDITDPQTIEDNNKNIWHLLSNLLAQDLIAMRGENSDTATQGWIDLSLATKSSDMATELATWFNSYPDHTAVPFAKTLTAANSSANPPKSNNLPLKGNIALILPFDNAALADKSQAFKLGLQAALNKNGIPNIIKDYASLSDQESFGDLYAYAKDEGASYFIGPLQTSELVEIEPVAIKSVDVESGKVESIEVKSEEIKQAETKPAVPILSLLDSSLDNDTSFQHAGFSLHDEAQTMATFANNHAIQHVTILAEDSEAGKQMVEAFQTVWQVLGQEAKLITLPKEIKTSDPSVEIGDLGLLDLKAAIANQGADMLLLAMSGEKARMVRPYLDISTPTLAFSSVNDADYNSLNAVRVVDIPFLLDKENTKYTYYQTQAVEIRNTELRRWFALGVDALQILLANARDPGSETVINGLTGKLIIDKAGHISRQLPIGRFTYNGVVLEN